MSNTTTLLRATLPLALIAVTACQDTSSPDSLDKFDPAAALADYQAMDAVRQSIGWRGFQLAAPQMAAGLTSQPLASGEAPAGLAAQGLPLISEGNRGKTFVYDATLHRWVADPSQTEAPANGVRFITYEPNGIEPDPTRPIGHADLIDLGDTADGIALRLVVVEGSLTIVDYCTTLAGGEGSGHVTVDGFIQNAHDKLDFALDVHGQNAGGVAHAEVSVELGIATRDFHVEGNLESEKQNGVESGAIDLHVRHGPRSFAVDVQNESGSLDGAIDLNDAPFALVSGPAQQPVFTRPDGGNLRPGEALVLWRIFGLSKDVFDLSKDLVGPIAGLVLWAVIL